MVDQRPKLEHFSANCSSNELPAGPENISQMLIAAPEFRASAVHTQLPWTLKLVLSYASTCLRPLASIL